MSLRRYRRSICDLNRTVDQFDRLLPEPITWLKLDLDSKSANSTAVESSGLFDLVAGHSLLDDKGAYEAQSVIALLAVQ